MKKTMVIASLIILAAMTTILGFSNNSWAAERPNTPECADINGRSDPDACHIQYIEPLLLETEKMWNRLMKLQGKNAAENPWTFKVDSPACDPDSQDYDEKFCLLQMPGKLALEKYRLREEVIKLEVAQKLKRQKTKLAFTQTTVKKLTEENKKLAEKLANVEQKVVELEQEKTNQLKEPIKVKRQQVL